MRVSFNDVLLFTSKKKKIEQIEEAYTHRRKKKRSRWQEHPEKGHP